MKKIRIACPACGGIGASNTFNVNGYDVNRCAMCGTLFVRNLPSPEDLAAIYSTDDYYELPPESMQRIKDENQRRLRVIRRMKPKGKLLDIGCAQGLILDLAMEDGYATFGIEPSSRNAEIAAQKGHVVFNGWLEEFVTNDSDERFDIITCLDVIEHIRDPKTFLLHAVSLMSEDGVIVISTPNYSGVVAKALGVRDPYMTPPEHLTFLTTSGLERLASECGLRVEEFMTFGKLVSAEMDRAVQRYFPRPARVLMPVIRPIIQFSFFVLNLLKLGLEQEVYLRKPSAA